MQEIIPLSPKIAETHQSSLIQLNKKLKVYSLFKQDSKKSRDLDLIKNTNHRRTVAKFRTRNHNTGDTARPNFLNISDCVNTVL